MLSPRMTTEINSLNSRGANPSDVAFFDSPEHVVDGFDGIHQFLCVDRGDLYLAGTTQFGSLPEGIVKIWNCFKMLWLEEVGPKDQKFLLAFLGLLFLDCSIATHGVEICSHRSSIGGVWTNQSKHLVGHRLYCFTSHACAGRVVYSTWSVTVSRGFNSNLFRGHG